MQTGTVRDLSGRIDITQRKAFINTTRGRETLHKTKQFNSSGRHIHHKHTCMCQQNPKIK